MAEITRGGVAFCMGLMTPFEAAPRSLPAIDGTGRQRHDAERDDDMDQNAVDGHDLSPSNLGARPAVCSSRHATRLPCCGRHVALGWERSQTMARHFCRCVSMRPSEAAQGPRGRHCLEQAVAARQEVAPPAPRCSVRAVHDLAQASDSRWPLGGSSGHAWPTTDHAPGRGRDDRIAPDGWPSRRCRSRTRRRPCREWIRLCLDARHDDARARRAPTSITRRRLWDRSRRAAPRR